jgi:putative transposase
MIAADLRRRRPRPDTTWHLDEVYLKIAGRMVYLWRAVDAEGEILDVLVQSKRNKHAALKLMRKLLKKYDGFVPDRIGSGNRSRPAKSRFVWQRSIRRKGRPTPIAGWRLVVREDDWSSNSDLGGQAGEPELARERFVRRR